MTECPVRLHIVSCIKRRHPLSGTLHRLRLHLHIQTEWPLIGSPGYKELSWALDKVFSAVSRP